MRKTICICDRCGNEITDGVVYSLTCYAENVSGEPLGIGSGEVLTQNMKQNLAETKELCRECKRDLTDGLFIL